MVDAHQHQEQVKGRNELIQTFLYTIRSKETQNLYQRQIGYFEEFHKQPVDKLLTLDTKVIEQILISYTVSMHNKKLSYATIHSRLAAMSSFLELNDVSINKKKIRKFMGENIRTVKDEASTHEDLLKMCEQSSFCAKLIIAIYSSTGIRKAALADLQLCHLTKIEEKGIRLYKFVIYENTKDEYITFCTPECANLIDAYLDQRRKAGEKITDESYLIRNDFNYFGINARKSKEVNGSVTC